MQMQLQKEQVSRLVSAALQARKNAYVPYSKYAVGAALLTVGDDIYTGCNVENASYGATNCAERTAFFKAVSEGNRRFRGIAIAGGIAGEEPVDYAYPCGVCRQVIKEFCDGDFEIIVVKSATDYKIFTLNELLPYGFGGESIR